MVPDALVGAARLYLVDGQEAKARELYAQVPQHGHGWFTGLALLDQADHLVRQNKHEEARKLLRQPVKGEGTERAQVLLKSLLGYSFYQTQNFDLAHYFLSEAVACYDALQKRGRGEGLEGRVALSRELLQDIRQ